jgi:hypothetical protein
MWEGVARPGRLGAAEAFCRDVVVPAALRTTGCAGAEWFTDGESRVVVITRWPDAASAAAFTEPTTPDPGLDRAHAWVFAVGPG